MENRRIILAIALVLFVWSGFNMLYPSADKKQDKPQNNSDSVNNIENIAPERPSLPIASNLPITGNFSNKRKIKVSSDLFDLVFSSNGARLIDAQLNHFKKTNTPNSLPVKLIDSSTTELGSYDVFGSGGLNIPGDLSYNFVGKNDDIYLSPTDITKLEFQTNTSDNLQITKRFTFYPEKYYFDIDIIIHNLSSNLKSGHLNLSIVSKWDDLKKGDSYNFAGAVSYNGKDVFNDDSEKLKEKSVNYKNDILWTSFTTKYFSNIIKPINDSINDMNIEFKNNFILNTITSSKISIESNQAHTFKYKAFVGPKNYELLKEPGLSFENIIDLGFFGIIGKPLKSALTFFNGYIGNFGWSIILLTICIKALFWPLTQKSYSSMKNMQKLQPQMVKLRAKHGKDKQKLNQEMMALYKENRVNPFGGCLPMLVQIPVFFALYQVLLGGIELRHAPFMLWITDLSAADTLISDALGLGFALGPLPIIMGFTMFLQQKMTPTNMDPTQAKIMLFMPVFFTFIFLSFPSGLVIYWLVNNILTIAQQYLINRKPA